MWLRAGPTSLDNQRLRFDLEPQASCPRVTVWILKNPDGTEVSDSASFDSFSFSFYFFFLGWLRQCSKRRRPCADTLLSVVAVSLVVFMCKTEAFQQGGFGGETGEVFCHCWGRRG